MSRTAGASTARRSRPRADAAAVLAVGLALVIQPSGARAQQGAGSESRSIVEDWREVLAYGIDEEVLQALDSVRAARETSLAGDMTRVLGRAVSASVRVRILDILAEWKDPGAEATAATLASEESSSEDLVLAALRYLGAIESSRLPAVARGLLDREKLSIAGAAVRALKHDPSAGQLLLERLDSERTPAELKPDIIRVLGEIGYLPAYDRLAGVLADRSQDKAWRMYAAESLGRLGKREAVPLLRTVFAEDDALLRAYAAAALGRFHESGVSELLMDALRDSNWRVRVIAAQALGERRDREATEILAYKARRDPVAKVRTEAIAALGAIGGREALETLRDLLLSEGSATEIRLAALEALVQHDACGSVDAIQRTLAAAWSKDSRTGGRLVEQIAGSLAQKEEGCLVPVLARLLEHPNPNVRVAALRGLARNRASGQRDRIERISREDPVAGVRKEALAALQRLD